VHELKKFGLFDQRISKFGFSKGEERRLGEVACCWCITGPMSAQLHVLMAARLRLGHPALAALALHLWSQRTQSSRSQPVTTANKHSSK